MFLNPSLILKITKHLQYFGFLGTQRLHRWGSLCDTDWSFAPRYSMSQNCLIMSTIIKAENYKGYKVWHSVKLQPRPILKHSARLVNLTNLEE